jgi:hypothetical protein
MTLYKGIHNAIFSTMESWTVKNNNGCRLQVSLDILKGG